jgi:hypothetical protein
MAIPTIEKREEYIGYAELCVKLARQTNDQESRRILREMAAEWLRAPRTMTILLLEISPLWHDARFHC